MLNIFLSLFGFSAWAQAASWDLNDVTYLLPLPTAETDALYIQPGSGDFLPRPWWTRDLAGPRGLSLKITPAGKTVVPSSELSQLQAEIERETRERELHAEAQAQALPLPSSGGQQRQPLQTQQSQGAPRSLSDYMTFEQYEAESLKEFNRLRVVALRIDPCFKDSFVEACRKQIRAVWQPITNSGAEDSAVHTFYDLSDVEFRDVIGKLQGLKRKFSVKTSGLALGIHPGFQNPAFLKSFNDLMRPYLRSDRITRIAFFVLQNPTVAWTFKSFDVKAGVLSPLAITGLAGLEQAIEIGWRDSRNVAVQVSDLSLNFLVRPPKRSAGVETATSLLMLESPQHSLPGTVDCFSCHAAHRAKNDPTRQNRERLVNFKGRYNLFNTSTYETDEKKDEANFRALGYFRSRYQIADRVILESASVADLLNKTQE